MSNESETIEKAKNEVALKNGWNDWDSLVIWHRESGLTDEIVDYIDQAMQEYANLQNAELKAEIERLKEEYSRLEYKCEYGIWPKPGM